MSASNLEYMWLDGYQHIQGLHSKIKIEREFSGYL